VRSRSDVDVVGSHFEFDRLARRDFKAHAKEVPSFGTDGAAILDDSGLDFVTAEHELHDRAYSQTSLASSLVSHGTVRCETLKRYHQGWRATRPAKW
jgi:hypothetical protein